MDAGHALRRMRETNGLTLREISESIGVSQTYLSDIERGNRPMTEAIAGPWCKAIGADDAEIACLTDCVPVDIKRWLLADPNRIRAVRETMKRKVK